MRSQRRRNSAGEMCTTYAHGSGTKADDDSRSEKDCEVRGHSVEEMADDLDQGGDGQDCASGKIVGEISQRYGGGHAAHGERGDEDAEHLLGAAQRLEVGPGRREHETAGGL